jgi:putative ABC transport system permease protein
VIENLLLAVLGIALGLVLGTLLTWIVSSIGIPVLPPSNADAGYTARIRMRAGTRRRCGNRLPCRHRRGVPPAVRVPCMRIADQPRHGI